MHEVEQKHTVVSEKVIYVAYLNTDFEINLQQKTADTFFHILKVLCYIDVFLQ